jgi:hypothetical protein
MTALSVLLPTPNTGTSPSEHGRRGGAPGNGHQSDNSLETVLSGLTLPGRLSLDELATA